MENQDTFYFLKATEENIQNKKFICFHILDFEKCIVFRIFKTSKYSADDINEQFNIFEEITDKISFAIKRDGKISLDINF